MTGNGMVTVPAYDFYTLEQALDLIDALRGCVTVNVVVAQ